MKKLGKRKKSGKEEEKRSRKRD